MQYKCVAFAVDIIFNNLYVNVMPTAAKVKQQVCSDIEYPYSEAPAPAQLRELASGVYWLRMPLPFAPEHINLWLLADGDGWAVVDCGFGTDRTRELWHRIFAVHLGGRPITRVIVTHFHPDHFGLAAWFAQEWQAPVLMTEPEFASAQEWFASSGPCTRDAFVGLFREHGLNLAGEHAPQNRDNLFRRGVPQIPAQIIALHDEQILDIDGRSWRVAAGHGHSPEHAALLCDELSLMIAGDMVLPRISTNVSVQPEFPDGDPLGNFLGSLRRYLELDAGLLVLPSHGLPFYGLHQRLQALTQHHAERLDELRRACRTPHTAAAAMPLLFKRELDLQETFFAMGETLSHLNHLMHRGELRRERGADGICCFERG